MKRSPTGIAARGLAALACGVMLACAAGAAPRPNLLWITSEDHGPQVGCYGDPLAVTPNIDRLASRGLRYTRVWSCAPVCAPARTTLISGLYATSTGGEHMRSLVRLPADRPMFPSLLREAGYYCVNHAKEDYNLAPPRRVWDVSAKAAHWRNRAAGQPFFAVFNSERSHESRVRARPHTPVLDPARVRVPAYHPDTPEVRRDWAQYYDVVSQADADAGRVLAQLEADGLAGDTIVFYFADHGAGLPRSKRWPFDSGLRVPLVVYIPEKFRALRPPGYAPGAQSDRLVSFVDFAPTMLSLAGVEPPSWMQGRAFLGPYRMEPPEYLHGFRGRMDERLDLVRSVTDGRFVYIRNYHPELIYGQHIDYMFQMPTVAAWKRLHDEGRLAPVQAAFWRPKPAEELYDVQADPDEVANLAASPAHAAVRDRLRRAQREQVQAVRDVGFVPEGERMRRAGTNTLYELGHDDRQLPLGRVVAAAELAAGRDPGAIPELRRALADPDGAVRYWGAVGVLARGSNGVAGAQVELSQALRDAVPEVRCVAAQALAQHGDDAMRRGSVAVLVSLADWSRQDVFTTMAALNALDALGAGVRPAAEALRALPDSGPAPHARYQSYVPRLLEQVRGGAR